MIKSWAADTLVIDVPVTFEAGAAISDLTGGAAIAVASHEDGAIQNGAATVVGAALVRVVFTAGSLAAGIWNLQVRVTVSSVVRTLVDTDMSIAPSL
jgi:hypothetical protein